MPFDLAGDFRQTSERGFEGHAFDRSDLTRKLVIEIVIDGEVVRTMPANAWVPSLAGREQGDGCYGFAWLIPEAWAFPMRLIEARVANLGLRVGAALPLTAGRTPAAPLLGSGIVTWQGGDRLTGSCASITHFPLSLLSMAGDMLAGVSQPSGWALPGAGEPDRPWPAFDLRLPPELADGRVHRLKVVDAAGGELRGSPLTLQVPLPVPDGLPGLIHEQLVPRSLPFSLYREQQLVLRQAQVERTEGAPKRVGVIFVGETGLDQSVAALQKIDGPEWVAAVLDETAGPGSFAPEMLAETLTGELAACDIVIVTVAGMELSGEGLGDFLRGIDYAPSGRVFTADWAWTRAPAGPQPVLLPAFDPERFLEQGYCGFLFAMTQPELLRRAEAGADSLFQLVCAGPEDGGSGDIHHVEGILGHFTGASLGACAPTLAAASSALLAGRGEAAAITVIADLPLPAIHVRREKGAGRLSIVLPEPASEAALHRTLVSLAPACEAHESDIVIVTAEGSALVDAVAALQAGSSHIRQVTAGTVLNRAAQMNAGAAAAAGDLICFIDAGCIAPATGWPGELMGRLVPGRTGAAGGLLVHQSGLILDGGRVLGPEFSAVPAFADRLASEPGFTGLLTVAHEVSGLGEGCLMIRRTLFEAIGGYDQSSFARHFTKADLCLRLRERGFATIFTPHVRFTSDSAPLNEAAGWAPETARRQVELRNFRNCWADYLQRDPAYNTLLNRDRLPYTGLSFPPAPERQTVRGDAAEMPGRQQEPL